MPDQEVLVVVRLKAEPDSREQLINQITGVLIKARSEPGYIVCELHEDADERGHFVLYERWANLETLLAYNNQPYHKEFEKSAQGLCVRAGEFPTYVGNIQAARFQQINF